MQPPRPPCPQEQPSFFRPRAGNCCSCFLEADEILRDPSAHHWLKVALAGALALDPVDAANDAEVLAGVLDRWSTHVLGHHSPSA